MMNSKRLAAPLALLLVLCGSIASAQQEIGFLESVVATNLADIAAVTGGDFDGDGDRDIAVAHGTVGLVALYLNDGAGVFAFSQSAGGLGAIVDLEAGDVDGDGDDDFVTASANGTVTRHSFAATGIVSVVVPVTGTLVRFGDFDGNAARDFVVRRMPISPLVAASVTLVRNAPGNPVAATQLLNVGGTSTPGISDVGVETSDVDGDGDDDLIIAFTLGGNTTIRLQLVSATTSVGGSGLSLPGVVGIRPGLAADFDGDQAPEIVLGSASAPEIRAIGGPLSGASALSPVPVWSFRAGGPPLAIAAADFDGDLDRDLVLALGSTYFWNGSYDAIQIVRRLQGGFDTPVDFRLPGRPVDMNVADFSGDGNPDILVATANPNELRLLRSAPTVQPTALTIGVVSGDGQAAPFWSSAPAPVVLQVTDPAGAPVAGLPLRLVPDFGTLAFTSGSSIGAPPGSTFLTDALGRLTLTVQTAPTLGSPVTAASQTFRVAVSGDRARLASFQITGQTAPLTGTILIQPLSPTSVTGIVNGLFATPIVVRAVTATGQPIAGLALAVNSSAPAIVQPTANIVTTDAAGLAFVGLEGGGLPGTATVAISIPSIPVLSSIAFGVTTIATRTLSIVSGAPQSGTIFENYLKPIVVQATAVGGSPLGGATVSILTAGGALAATGTTDAAGLATLVLPAGAGTGTRSWLVVSDGAVDLGFTTFNRWTSTAYTAGNGLFSLSFGGDVVNAPLLLMADAPQPAPIPTIVGNLYTSLLAPGPSFLFVDGIGLLGPPAFPPILGSPNLFLVTALPPGFLAGQTRVFQILGFDASEPFPDAYFLSNQAPQSF